MTRHRKGKILVFIILGKIESVQKPFHDFRNFFSIHHYYPMIYDLFNYFICSVIYLLVCEGTPSSRHLISENEKMYFHGELEFGYEVDIFPTPPQKMKKVYSSRSWSMRWKFHPLPPPPSPPHREIKKMKKWNFSWR